MKITQLPMATIDGEGVRLRPPRESDAGAIAAACADPSTVRFVHAMPDPYTRADAMWWITEGGPQTWLTGGAAYVITDPDTDEVVGGAGIDRVMRARSQGEIGYWVAPQARGRGVATAAARALTVWAFHHDFGRLELLTEEENALSQRVALGAGYQRECIRRSGGVGRDGSRHDLIVWTRLPGDPPGPARRLLPDLPGGELSDGTVTLRPLRTDDVDDVLVHRGRPDLVATRVPPQAPDRADIVRLCARAESAWLAGTRALFTIRDAASDAFAGEISLYYGAGIGHADPALGQAMIGYGIEPAWRRRGFAARAVRQVAGWAFAHTSIRRLTAGTSPQNIGSQRVLERTGFTREGLLRSLLPTADGGHADDLLYGLLPGDLR